MRKAETALQELCATYLDLQCVIRVTGYVLPMDQAATVFFPSVLGFLFYFVMILFESLAEISQIQLVV